MSRQGVWVRGGALDAALAQLPDRVERAASPAGSILVLDGRRERPERVQALLAEGPLAVILTDPASATQGVLDRLAGAGAPVVADRPLLGADDAAGVAGAPVRHVVVDALAARADERSTLVDAVGWARTIAGGDLSVRASARTHAALLAALASTAGVGVALTVTRLAAAIGPALSVDGLGERRVEVRIDRAAGVRDVAVHGEDGAVVSAPRYESPQRLTLRRALAAVAGEPVDDLAELIHDRTVADLLTGTATP